MNTHLKSCRWGSVVILLGLLLRLSACGVQTKVIESGQVTQDNPLLGGGTVIVKEIPYPPSDELDQGVKVTGELYPPSRVNLPTELPFPTELPTPTHEPAPTPVPTPIVTAIPLAYPPFIPEVAGIESQPFWFISWKDNQISRIDSLGKDKELLVDVYKETGQWLTDIPDVCKDNDACTIYSRVVASPDGQKLALVVVDKIETTSFDFTFNIFLFDIQTRTLKFLSEGQGPGWSDDGQQIAYLKNNGLWVVDLGSGQSRELVPYQEGTELIITEYAWSPDNQQIAYLYNYGHYQRLNSIWVVNVADDIIQPKELLRLDPTLSIYGLLWSPDNQNLFYLSMDGTKDVIYALAENLWSVSIKTGERTQLTYDIDVSGYQISWDNHWFFLSGYSLYEPRVDGVIYDLWLLSMDGNNIYRLTANNDNTFMGGICPDGTSLVIWSSDQLMLLNLNSGDIIPLEFDLSWNYSIGGIK